MWTSATVSRYRGSAAAAVLAGACIVYLAGLLQWSSALLSPRLRVQTVAKAGSKESKESGIGLDSNGLSLSKLATLAKDFETRYVRTGKMKGGLLAVVRSGKVVGVWEMGKYSSDTVFKFFSISKVFTAIAGLQLCEEKGISLETPISSLVPEWPANLRSESGEALPALLLKHCLTHTGGFSKALPTVHPMSSLRAVELRRIYGQRSGKAGKAPQSLQEAVELEGRYPHIFAPGCHFNYCGVGSQLVARAVEEAFGMNIAEYMEQHMFKPASMNTMGFVLDESLSHNCVSTDYHPWVLPAVAATIPSRWRRWKLWIKGLCHALFGSKLLDNIKPAGSGVILPVKLWDRSLKFFHPDAGLVGTGTDFVKWLQIMTANGTAPDVDKSEKLFSQFVLDSLATPITPELEPPFALDAPPAANRLFPVRGDPSKRSHRPFNRFPGQQFSLGGCVITDPKKADLPARAEGTWHWMGFASTYFFVNPREELSACFLTQLVSHRTYPILDELVKGVHESLT